MAVRSLDQILKEIGSVYEPQIQNIQKRQQAIPGQIQSETKGLEARQQQAFGDILAGARRRGTGVAFGGIPLGEQARYTATEFLPALARLQQSGREQAMSLEDALNQIRERKQSQALGIRQYEQQRFDAQQQFERQLAEQRRQAAAASAANNSWMSALGRGQTQGAQTPSVNPQMQNAYNSVRTFLSQGRDAARSDYQATLRSANHGNAMDQMKIRLYHQLNPDWFGRGVPASAVVSNASQLRF